MDDNLLRTEFIA